MARNAQLTEDLMKSFGLDLIVPGEQLAVRFAILRFTAAIIKDPHRVVVPVIHYANADPVSGNYQKNADGSTPPIVWEVRYVCLRPGEVAQINRLLDDNQTPCDIDLVMTPIATALGYYYGRASKETLWTLNAEIVKKMNESAQRISDVFAAKLTNASDATIFDDFQAVEAALFPANLR